MWSACNDEDPSLNTSHFDLNCLCVCVCMCACVRTRGQSQWLDGLRHGSAAAHFLELWVRILPSLSAVRVFRNGLITHTEESYQMWFI